MREIEKERLSPMDVCTDFAKTREKFTNNYQFIKARHPKPSGDNPNQEYGERRQPRPPTAPRTVGPAVFATARRFRFFPRLKVRSKKGRAQAACRNERASPDANSTN